MRHALAALVLMALGAGAGRASDAPIPLAGEWELDPAHSDDPSKALARPDGPAPGGRAGLPPGSEGGGRRPPAGVPGAGGRRGRGASGVTPEMESLMREFRDAPARLSITQTADEVAIDDGTRTTRFHPDGRKRLRENGAVETEARWRDAALLVDSRIENGPQLSVTYVREGDALRVTAEIDGPRGRRTLRRVYRAAPAAAHSTGSS